MGANIGLLLLPDHSSHVLQPLGPGTFSPLKSRYRKKSPTSPTLMMLHQSRSDALSNAIKKCVQRPSALGFYVLGGWLLVSIHGTRRKASIHHRFAPQILHLQQRLLHLQRPRSDGHGDPNMIFPTLKHPWDVYRSIQQLGSNLNREQRIVL